MNITYRQAALDDLTRQVRYYLVDLDKPDTAARFAVAVRESAAFVKQHPLVAPLCVLQLTRLRNLRSWPVRGFEQIRLYFLIEDGSIQVIRILHGKRDVRRILEKQGKEVNPAPTTSSGPES